MKCQLISLHLMPDNPLLPYLDVHQLSWDSPSQTYSQIILWLIVEGKLGDYILTMFEKKLLQPFYFILFYIALTRT